MNLNSNITMITARGIINESQVKSGKFNFNIFLKLTNWKLLQRFLFSFEGNRYLRVIVFNVSR